MDEFSCHKPNNTHPLEYEKNCIKKIEDYQILNSIKFWWYLYIGVY